MPKNQKVDAYIAQAPPYAKPILKKLRTLVHTACQEVEEKIKWGAPAFDHKGSMFLMAARKKHVVAGFWKDEKLGDKATRLRLGELGSLDQLPSDAAILALLKEHIRINEAAAAAPKRVPARRKTTASGEGRAIQFTSVIEIREGNPYVLVSATRADTLKPGWRKPMPVCVQVNGLPETPWRINMMPTGDGAFYLYLHGEIRKASGTRTGDRIQVSVRFDDTYAGGPQQPIPKWFGDPLSKNKPAKANWEKLPPSRKKEVVRHFSTLKSDAARARNLAMVLQVLSGQPGRFMARDWKDGK